MNRKNFLTLTAFGIGGIVLRPIHNFAKPFYLDKDVVYYSADNYLYNELRRGFNLRLNKKPKLIAVCANENGVIKAIKLAKQQNLAVSIKSGGHCMEGFSGSEGGMQLIVSSLNKITWKDNFTIEVGPGCLLKNIYEEIIPKGKILPGGSCATVAIGGLALGGGYGLLSRLFGLTCDSLLSLNMVDGNGNLLEAKQNSEVLWACKGGGNGNFGVITSMTFRVHNRPKVMSSYRFRSFKLNTPRAKEILKQWMQLAKTLPKSCFSTCLFNGDTAYILLTNTSSIKPEMQQFIAAMKKLSDKTTTNLNQLLPLALKNYYGQAHPLNFKNASAGLYTNFQELEPFIDAVLEKVLNTKGMIFQFNTLGGLIMDKTAELQSCFPHRAFFYFTELQTYWEEDKQEAHFLERFEEVQQLISSHGITAQYRNYPDINLKNYLESYYGKNLVRLKKVKQQFDPENRIRHEQSI